MKIKNLLIPLFLTPVVVAPIISITSCAPEEVPITSLSEFEYTQDDATHEITIEHSDPHHKYPSSINISDTYNIVDPNDGVTYPYAVTKIGYEAFFRAEFKSIILPSTIRVIDDFAFTQINCPDMIETENLDDTNPNSRDQWVCSFDLSRCNDLETIGCYAFHYNTVDVFKMPTNNHKLKSTGDDAFCGLRLWHNWDLTGLKALDQLDEWAFYGVQSGKGNVGHTSVTIPSTVTTLKACGFTWSECDTVYWNIDTPPTIDKPTSGMLGIAPTGITFFLSNIKEFHVSKNANRKDWEDFCDANSSLKITILGTKIEIIGEQYRINWYADLNEDGSIDPNGEHVIFGKKDFDEKTIKDVIDVILGISIPNTEYTLEDVAKVIPQVDQYIIEGCPENEQSARQFFYDILYVAFGGADDNTPEKIYTNRMLQCELYLLWDRYFKLDQDLGTN